MLLHKFNWKKEVIESPEPVLVDFWAEWCGPCKPMNPAIESLAKDFKVCKVNLDSNQPLAAAYKIDAIPALMIFNGGRIAWKHVGAVGERTIRAELEKLKSATH